MRAARLSGIGSCLPFLLIASIGLPTGCGGDGDSMLPGAVPPGPPTLIDSPVGDEPIADPSAGRVTTLRVHYPLASDKSLSVRGALAPFTWSSGVTMTRRSADLFELRIRDLPSELEWKPLVNDTTWSRGQNYRAKPGQTVDIYPHFFTPAGRYVRHYTAFSSTLLGNRRGVWLYLPPSFDETRRPATPCCTCTTGRTCSIRAMPSWVEPGAWRRR